MKTTPTIHNRDRDAELLAATAPRRHACQAAIGDYVARTGLNLTDFGERIGYSRSSMQHFMKDRYHQVSGDDSRIIAAAQTYLEAHPIQCASPVMGEIFETANVRLIHDTFAQMLFRPRAFVIYAPPGSQKTFVLEHEVAALNLQEASKESVTARAHYVYTRQGIRPHALLKRVAQACGIRSDGNVDRILNNLRAECAGKKFVLVFDEAQHMSIECFEILRELLDRGPFFSLLFAGSHELFSIFERGSATLEQWNSRIAKKVRLPGATVEEALAIVEREIGPILRSSTRKTGPSPEDLAHKIIAAATVVDGYVPVRPGQPKATYTNIRTLCNALDDLRTQFAAAQKASAA